MTTDEALEFCKRLDDPKFQSLIGTDLSRATGTTGALLALRAEIEALRGKVNDLDAFLAEWERLGSGIEILPKIVRMRIRELGLITEARDESTK